MSCFSLPLLFLFINQLYRVKRNLSIFIPLLLFCLMECQQLFQFWRAPLYHGMLKPTVGFKSCDYSSHSWWQIQLYSFKYIQNFWLPHQSLVSILSGENPTVGKIIIAFTLGFLWKKNKPLSFLYTFFLSLLVEAFYSFYICIFIFSCTPQMCCSLPRLPLHSRKKYMFVLNKCSIHSYSAALVWIHSYSSPAPSKTVNLFRRKGWWITIGINSLPLIS